MMIDEEKTKEDLIKELSEARIQLSRIKDDTTVDPDSDYAERKRLEREALKLDKLESLGLLAAGIAHEFNNILTVISGNIALAKMYAKPDSEMADILYESEKATRRAEKLTQQLLVFSKGGVFFKKSMRLDELLTELCLKKEEQIVSSELSLASDLWPIEGDATQIRNAVSNIIENARDSMPNGGIIRIEAENTDSIPASVPSIRPGKYVRISVSDQGPGIEDTLIESIFEPFFTTKHKGSGLGLTTSFSIIQGHDGYITVESEPGSGTTFHIYIPAATEVSPNSQEGKRYKVGHKRILIMDDDELVRTVLERMLNQCNCSAEFSSNGEEMLTKYKEAKEAGKPFDIVIMDLIISSGMGGKDAIKKLLDLDPGAKAIVSSGYSDDRIMANFRDYGFKGSLPKPYLISTLSRALNDVITGAD